MIIIVMMMMMMIDYDGENDAVGPSTVLTSW